MAREKAAEPRENPIARQVSEVVVDRFEQIDVRRRSSKSVVVVRNATLPSAHKVRWSDLR